MSSVARISSEQITQVREANDIVDVIGAYLELKPAGARLKALCPFHQEKTPSFSVSRDRQMYHCFGCGKSGDVLGFVMDHEGLSFLEAVEKLADRAGIRLAVARDAGGGTGGERIRTRTLELLDFARRAYQKLLESPEQGAAGRAYLEKRALGPETVQRFGLGYAPGGWSTLLDAARKKGYDDAVLEASGLFKRSERGGWYDHFRERLMFPIFDVTGRTVAFGGRDLTGESPAKYINSPETLIYKKSRVLYGLREAREAMQRERKALVVEGYFDLLRCVDAGIENVTATCGTALTDGQANLLRRYVPEVTVVFDGDAAGIKAACRALAVLARAGLGVSAMALPGGEDPDDFIRSAGADAFRVLVEGASDFVTFIAEMSPDRARSVEGRTELAREIFEVIAAMDDEIRRDEYLKRTAHVLELNVWKCRDEFSRYLRGQKPARPAEEAEDEPAAWSQEDVHFVAALLDAPDMMDNLRAMLARTGAVPGVLGEVLAALAGAGTEHRALAAALDGGALRLYAAAVNSHAPAGEAGRQVVQKGLAGLEREALRVRAGRLQADLEVAERTGDTARMMALLQEKVALDQAKDPALSGRKAAP